MEPIVATGRPEGLSRTLRPAPHGSSPERPAARQARSTPAGPRRGLTSALEASPPPPGPRGPSTALCPAELGSCRGHRPIDQSVVFFFLSVFLRAAWGEKRGPVLKTLTRSKNSSVTTDKPCKTQRQGTSVSCLSWARSCSKCLIHSFTLTQLCGVLPRPHFRPRR